MLTNITNYNQTGDWFYIVIAAIVVDFVVIVMAKYAGPRPFFKVQALNDWYTRFGALAAVSDITSALIGIAAARYIYSAMGLKGVAAFVGCILGFQLFHDAFFYLAVIQPLPKGENDMIDVFKAYAAENGAMILGADALILLATAGLGSVLKELPVHFTVSTAFISMYAMTYILYTKPK
ncbi:MAG: hypothetical protein EBU66_08615 [Bacteroidetes bacterium]|nr:hypothetical protein [bacterium]NBP64710.1 hypothetical protein [Bacteroidota bacterium]